MRLSWIIQGGPGHSQGRLNGEEEGRGVRVRALQCETQHVLGGLRDGRGPGTKECGQCVERLETQGKGFSPRTSRTKQPSVLRTFPSATAGSPLGKFQHLMQKWRGPKDASFQNFPPQFFQTLFLCLQTTVSGIYVQKHPGRSLLAAHRRSDLVGQCCSRHCPGSSHFCCCFGDCLLPRGCASDSRPSRHEWAGEGLTERGRAP